MGFVVVKFRKTGDVHVVGDAGGDTESMWNRHNANAWNRETGNLVDMKFFDDEEDAHNYAYPKKAVKSAESSQTATTKPSFKKK